MSEPNAAELLHTIREMVERGESGEKIVGTLKELGVAENKARRLTVLAQTDTFSLLRGEIKGMVSETVEKEKPALERFLEEEARKAVGDARKELGKQLYQDLKSYEKEITGQSKTFQEQINETVSNMAELSGKVREKLNELGEQVKQLELDLKELRLKGVGSNNRAISIVLVVAGLLFFAFDVWMFYNSFGGAVSIDSLIITVVVGLIGITCLFVATLI